MIKFWSCVCFFTTLAVTAPCLAMNTYEDPRTVLSYMDKSLQAGHDILRLTTDVTENEDLVFQVKTRGEAAESGGRDYVLLQVWQKRLHLWLIPLGSSEEHAVLAYEGDPAAKGRSQAIVDGKLDVSVAAAEFSAAHIRSGVEFTVPLSWIDYREQIGFDAYTIRGRTAGNSFVVEKVYDRAAKGSRVEPRVSPIKLLNNLCATRR